MCRRISAPPSRRVCPSTSTCPLVGRIRSSRRRIVVVLPAPFGPRKPTTSPGSTVNDRSSTACTAPKCFVNVSQATAGPIPPSSRCSRPAVRGGCSFEKGPSASSKPIRRRIVPSTLRRSRRGAHWGASKRDDEGLAVCARRVRAPVVDASRAHRLRACADDHVLARGPMSCRSTGRGRSRCATAPSTCAWTTIAGPTDGLGARSKFRVAGRCRASTSPHYTNVQMPFAGPPPDVPDDNPTGVYRRAVTVPATWARPPHRVARRRRGVGAVRARRRRAGRNGQGLAPAARVRPDRPRAEPGQTFELALTVVRWSDATYLEDQDHWYHAGLHRSVFLYATPPVYIADVHATADYDPETRDGRLDVRVAVDARGPATEGLDARGSRSADRARRRRGVLRASELGRQLPSLRGPGRRRSR